MSTGREQRRSGIAKESYFKWGGVGRTSAGHTATSVVWLTEQLSDLVPIRS